MTQVSIIHHRQLIRTLSYFVSTHAADALEDDNLSILDLENIVLTGQIVESPLQTLSLSDSIWL